MKTEFGVRRAVAVVVLAMAAAAGATEGSNTLTRDGLTIEFSMRPVARDDGKVLAPDWADVQFRVRDANTGEPIRARYPAAWLDLSQVWQARGEGPISCRDRIATYLKGIVGVRPMIDLNSHYLVVMNRDATLTVIDPAVGIAGMTNTFAQVSLEKPGADWAKSADQKKMFVTMPKAKKLAVVDNEVFKVEQNVDAGDEPTRVVLQKDQRYAWVGNDATQPARSGVTAIDVPALQPAGFIATGRGHHELALGDADRHLYVTNRDDGTVSVVDVRALRKLKDIEVGPLPISLAYSPLSKSVFVADAKNGTVTEIDPVALAPRRPVTLKPGLGPLRFSPDGRWGFVVNPSQNTISVIDASTGTVAHDLEVGDKPYEVTFTRQYAYVRSLGTERVYLIALSSLLGANLGPLQSFAAGEKPPGMAPDLGIAQTMVPAVKEAAAFLVNPAQGTIYFYMEGMVSPAGGFRNYGHEARSVEIADRSLREIAPGLYSGRAKLPLPGTYDVAFILDQPQIVHCFSASVEPNPAVKIAAGPMSVDYRIDTPNVRVGSTVPVRFRLSDPQSGVPLMNLTDVRVMYYTSAGAGRTLVGAKHVGAGEYVAEVKVAEQATYYVFVASASQKVKFTDVPFATLVGLDEATAKAFAAREEAARSAAEQRARKAAAAPATPAATTAPGAQ